ncbi:flavin reductase [Cupriavidus consociatus]|uniref:flavin reductase n=1 Tax=Cupriavidus consociatus TaxID=2821357 RepID=UPI001AE554DD|nr:MULTISPECIES: flavin reductase [unclassified Cupriavidus]MBP0625325.1 flavin reductase [Cupriavidus sp. LEh25]MDK2662062.1 flavin reductase [Cupriavidus sp. LEh21]
MPIQRQEYRDAMAQLGAAVNVITSAGTAGRYGMTASAVFSVTDDPPTLAVCVNRSSQSNAVFKANGVLCVNTLGSTQQEISGVFAGATKCAVDDRFKVGHWTSRATGAPVLEGAVVSFDCRITDTLEKGTHTIFFCEVEAVVQSGADEGLIYFRRNYHSIGDDAAA